MKIESFLLFFFLKEMFNKGSKDKAINITKAKYFGTITGNMLTWTGFKFFLNSLILF